jgi:hypothetical protein
MGMGRWKWIVGAVCLGGGVWSGRLFYVRSHLLFQGPLVAELLAPLEIAESGPDPWVKTSYGYHLVHWPSGFQGSPILTTMDYHKGPPKNFISEMVQTWGSGKAELSIEGPRTPKPGFGAIEWRSCLNSVFCFSNQALFNDRLVRDLFPERERLLSVSWFEVETLGGARGVHLRFDLGDRELDRYVVITDQGNTQNFTLRSSKDAVGAEARSVLRKILQGMRTTDDLKAPRDWIASRLKGVQLAELSRISDPRKKYLGLIGVQNLLFSQLAVDPRGMAPFFHLGGVVHLMGMSLARDKSTYFPNQESWSNSVQPLLTSLIQYVGDFPDSGKDRAERGAILSNLESLLQDYLLLKKKLSK